MTTIPRSQRAHLWLIHWPEIEPTLIRYQEAVTLDRVLSEHHAAVGAEPITSAALPGSFRARRTRVRRAADSL